MGTVVGTRRIGGPADDVLNDGTVMHPGDLGAGGYLIAGKVGGEGTRAYLNLRYASPKMDVNAIGYQQSQNQQAYGVNLRYFRSRDIGSLHELQLNFFANSWWTTDGQWTARGIYTGGEFSVVLPGYQQIGWGVNLEIPRYDVREVAGYGVPFERVGDVASAIFGSTDPNRPLVLSGFVFGARAVQPGPGQAAVGLRRRADPLHSPRAVVGDAAHRPLREQSAGLAVRGLPVDAGGLVP